MRCVVCDGQVAASSSALSGRTGPVTADAIHLVTHQRVYCGFMSRTNIELDDELDAEAMRRYGLSTKRAAVDLALRRLVGERMSGDEVLAMEGSGWDADLADLRTNTGTALR
jgi:Arc/MetJ family transcription regulator